MGNPSIDTASPPGSAESSSSLFAGGGVMGSLMRALDWSQTPLGPVENWPQSLKTTVSICLASRFPIVVYWGPEYVVLYNDAYSEILGSKHPWALGQTCRVCWAEIWDTIGPMLDSVLETGEATWSNDLLLRLRRFGYPEECYFSFSFSPVRVESGALGGVFTAVIETTENVIGERRLQTLRDLASRGAAAKSEPQVWAAAAGTLATNRHDVPFAVLSDFSAEGFRVTGAAGIESSHPLIAALGTPGTGLFEKAMRVIQTGQPESVEFGLPAGLPCGAWDVAPRSAMLLPIPALGQGAPGLLLAAVSPAKQVDESYRTFFELVARQIASNIADARAYQVERNRAEALAEIDRAKTVFFSNVSHEFRTPLTLMLGPLEEVLAHPPPPGDERAADEREQLAVVRRNALRLLKLVNALLDFARIEAGRVQAAYQPTDLSAMTGEVASVFRSAMERAGLRFTVECEPLPEPVYVDREMWEKIVLNLLSNAFKFTLAGEVAVRLRPAGQRVELAVRDTGAGIPAAEMPHLFERFHRIEGTPCRTHEGTGIGLALVLELVNLHGGSVQVESEEGRGSTFTVSLPLGSAHLPADRIGRQRATAGIAAGAESFVEDAQRWIAGEIDDLQEVPGASFLPEPAPPLACDPAMQRETVLVAEDNADMRQYLVHLLDPAYDIYEVADGIAAVEAAQRLQPALILTDVMMPGLDGFGVLNAVRADARLRGTPVILLSARAGEESRIEGLDAGADDYLIKPFTARELLARVGTHLRLAKIRREAAEVQTRLRAEAELERSRFRDMLSSAPAAMALLSGPEHRFTYVNNFYLRATGRNHPADLVGKTIRAALPELDGQPFFDLLDRVYRTGEPFVGHDVKVQLLRKRGSDPDDVYFDFIYQPMWNAAGDIEGILVHAVDITDKVVARKMLEDSHERLKAAHIVSQRLAAIVESSDDAIFSMDVKGIVASWNPCAERIFGYTAEEMIGQPVSRIVPPELQDEENHILATIARGERIQHFETVRMGRSGERFDVSLSVSPMRDENGQIVGASKIARDITQRKKSERVLRTTERLASVGRLAATIAHEINNPLEAVTNLVYLAKLNTTDAVVGQQLSQAEEELSRVSLLTRQTLGFYRETRGTVRLTISSLVSPLVFAFQARARNKTVEVRTEIHQDPEIMGIPGEIRQVIANLLSNAIDAALSGTAIHIRISAAGFIHGQRRNGVRLTIADAGPGIPPSIRQHLFEAFFTTKKEIGTGLGLWVCKSIVERHGGTIQLKSRTGAEKGGTVFSVILPAEPPPNLEESDSERLAESPENR